jgi:membrane protease YdiL (CAAX protease family)
MLYYEFYIFDLISIFTGVFGGIFIFIILYKTRKFLVKFSCFSIMKSNHIDYSQKFNNYNYKIKLVVILCSVIVEEIFFRSIAFNILLKYYDLVTSLLISSFVFAIIHFNNKIIELFIMGLYLGVLVIITENLLTSIIAHSINNIIIVSIKEYAHVE